MDPVLADALRDAAAALDTYERAWIIGVGRLVDLEPRGPFSDRDVQAVMEAVYAGGDFPVGAFRFAADADELEVNPTYQMAIFRHDLGDQPYLETKIAFGIAGFVAEGFTRSGWLVDHSREPSHAVLSDVEAVLAETTVLVNATARRLDYRGQCRLTLGIVSNVPDRPLRLRAYSEETGDLLPADVHTGFEPLEWEFRPGLERCDAHRLLWSVSQQAAEQFGVSQPQLLRDPEGGTPPPTGAIHLPRVKVAPR